MNYADAIVYLKENNITKEDGTFYEFGEVCVICFCLLGKTIRYPWLIMLKMVSKPL